MLVNSPDCSTSLFSWYSVSTSSLRISLLVRSMKGTGPIYCISSQNKRVNSPTGSVPIRRNPNPTLTTNPNFGEPGRHPPTYSDWLIGWLIEPGLTSTPTQYRLYGRRFLPARRYASAGYSDRNVSVRPSCLSRAGIVSKRRKLASWFLHHLIAPRLYFSGAKFHHQILRGSPARGPQTRVGRKNLAIF